LPHLGAMRNLTEVHRHCRCNFDALLLHNLFLYEPFLVPRALQAEGPCFGSSSSCYLRNYVGAPHPVRLGQVGGRPLGRMVRMGVVETHDFQTLLPYLLLNSDKLFRINGIAIPRGIASKVIATDRRNGGTSAIPEPPREHPATLLWIRFLAMSAQSSPGRGIDHQHPGILARPLPRQNPAI
jgi:hypothetical protein